MRHATLLMVLLTFLMGTSSASAQGRLDRVREGVDRPASPDTHADKPGCNDEDGFGNFLGEVFGPLFAPALFVPFGLPYACLSDNCDHDCSFRRYPYADGELGRIAREGSPLWSTDIVLRPLSLRVAVEESNNFQNLNRITGHYLLDTSSRLGVQGSWSWLREGVGSGRHRELSIGDANLVYRFAQGEVAEFRAGLGGRFLVDGGDVRGGFNATYGADFFPMDPLILSASVAGGTLGSAGVFHIRATAGAVWRHGEVYVGYDYLLIGEVDLQGPVVGLRVWF